ncbi:MAG: sensor histidine kinase [Flavobacterium sp.]|nr:sensor histidine kinase [Flavobacterium sp.]
MIYKYCIGLVLIVGLFSCADNAKKVKAQIKRNDSLDYFFQQANLDALPYKKKHLYADKALAIISKEANDSMNRVNYFKVANRYWNINAKEEYQITVKNIIKNAKTANDNVSLGKAYKYLGDYFSYKMNIDSAYLNFYNAEKISRKNLDYKNLIQCLLAKSDLQFLENDFIGSEKSCIEVMEYLKNGNDKENLCLVYSILGAVNENLGEIKKAKYYNEMSLELSKSKNISGTFQTVALNLNNLGCLYAKLGFHDKAISFYKKAIIQKNLFTERPDLYALIQENLAYSNLKLNVLNNLPNAFYNSLDIYYRYKNIVRIINCKSNISEYYSIMKDSTKAILVIKEAYFLAKEKNLQKEVVKCLKDLSVLDPTNAQKYFTEYNKINDSLQLAERRNRDKFARIEYETEELVTDKKNLLDEREKYLYTSFALLLLAIVFVVFGYYVLKNRQTQLEREQEQANAEIYQLMLEQSKKVEEGKQLEKKRISQELHDGVMGKLNSIRLNLFVLSRKTDPQTIQKCLTHINEIQDIEKEIRTIAFDLQKNVFSSTLDFEITVRNLFTSVENHSNINFNLHTGGNIKWDKINNKIKMQIYRILQEAIQNIDKYAEANSVNITMKKSKKTLVIAIEDDGKGFDEAKIQKGIGMKSMYTRAKEINAQIHIDSNPGAGTTIKLEVPV